ncbi:MAG: hypothetical protein OEW11_06375 [Nitrospirota bacterium]|nr:hypothetical protein [Nitrospirota bacterium]
MTEAPHPDHSDAATKAAPADKNWRLPLALVAGVIAAMGAMLLVMELGHPGGGVGGGGPQAGGAQNGAGIALGMDLMAIHRAATGAGVYQIRTGDPAELSAWFVQESGAAVPVPDLEGMGLEVSGGRLLRLLKQPAPMQVFQQPGGTALPGTEAQPPVVLILSPHGLDAEPLPGEDGPDGVRLASMSEVGMAFFTHGGRHWVVTSARDPEAMLSLARGVRAALSILPEAGLANHPASNP